MNTLSKAVNKTNMMYGGSRTKASRIVFVGGSIDPWNKLGLSYRTKYSFKILIQGNL